MKAIYEYDEVSTKRNTPKYCPKCAAKAREPKTQRKRYACGGQWRLALNAYWVGYCPKAEQCAEVGLAIDVPADVLADALKEAGLSPM